ncbi:MAG: hypothetical protein RIS64_1765, partial [Bacteroidota bacterium]
RGQGHRRMRVRGSCRQHDISKPPGRRCVLGIPRDSYNDRLDTSIAGITLGLMRGRFAGERQAQLIGAKKFNEMDIYPIDVLYGCSTTGIEWRFLKYVDNQIIIDEKRYFINELPQLLGVLQWIINTSKTADLIHHPESPNLFS